MEDERVPWIPGASWIPLRSQCMRQRGEPLSVGWVERYFGAVSIVVPRNRREDAIKLDWSDVECGSHRPYHEGDEYFPAGSFHDSRLDLRGCYPVLEQHRDADHGTEWCLDQDIVLGLELKREADVWVCPAEDYADVARLKRDADGRPELLEIRAEHMRDYLCGRASGLLVATYLSRRAVFRRIPRLTWQNDNPMEMVAGGRWKGSCRHVSSSGLVGGPVSAAVVSSGGGKAGGDSAASQTERRAEDGALSGQPRNAVLICGDLWRNDWVEPATSSPRILRECPEPTVPFIVENDGTTAVASEICGKTLWLWFKPAVVLGILRRRGGSLGWYSEDTGWVELASHSPLHFGVNDLGLVNVFAKDIAGLPLHVQTLWAAYNVAPDGGVCPELTAAQMCCNPATTEAPEVTFGSAVAALDAAALKTLGRPFLRPHSDSEQILRQVHRFQCCEPGGLYRLCKEITRFATDRIDVALLRRLNPGEDSRAGGLKRLERVLTGHDLDGRLIVAPLVGAYELRLADAHPAPSELHRALELLGVTGDMSEVEQGKRTIQTVACTLQDVARFIQQLPTGSAGRE